MESAACQQALDRILPWLENLAHPESSFKPTSPTPSPPTSCCNTKRDTPPNTELEGIHNHRHAKRRRLITPPGTSTSETSMSFPLVKRTFAQASSTPTSTSSASFADSYQDVDQTPTKSSRTHPIILPFGATPSRRSGSVSPKKEVRNAALTTTRTRSYDATQVPDALQDMWSGISEYDGGIGVIGHDERKAVEAAIEKVPEFREQKIRGFVFEDVPSPGQDETPPIGPRTSLGRTPTVPEVHRIVRIGKRCRDHGLDEQSWNAHVHTRILSLAFRGIWDEPDGSLLAHMLCPTASIISSYVESRSRKVDFCVCIQPDDVSALAISALRHQDYMTRLSINHTEYEPLQACPIALSIETKKHGEELGNAEAQLVTWHAAQWRVLERLVSRQDTVMPLPDFLPGIIIQGHEWRFVASTNTNGNITLWTSQLIGSTTRVLGVYQIVCVLQYIRRWIEQTYWPWYQMAVLQLPVEVHGVVIQTTSETSETDNR